MATLSRAKTWAAGETLTASDLNAEFDNVLSTVNGNLNDANLGVTAGIAAASKALVLDASRDLDDGTAGNQIRNLSIAGNASVGGNLTVTGTSTFNGGTITLGDAAGDTVTIGGTIQGNLIFEGSTANAYELTLAPADVTADRTLTMPDATDTLVGRATTDTLTNKTITSATLNTPTITGNTTFSDGSYNFNIASHDGTNGLALAGTVVTASAAELNILDGVTTTAAEINLIDGGTARGTTSVESGDGILINDSGTMRMTNVDTVSTYFASHSVGGTNIVTVGTVGTGTWQGTAVTVPYGGTGASSLTDGGVLLGSGTGAVTAMAVLADGEMIVGDGTTDPVAESGATLRTSIGVGTGDSPQFTGIELSHASANTLTASGGILSIEGVAIPTISSTHTFTNKTWNGAVIASAYLDSDTAHLTGTQTFTGAKTFTNTVTVGANDAGHDVILYGDTASANITWDTSEDDLILNGGAGLIVPDGQLTLGSTALAATAAELNVLDGVTAGTVAASKGVVVDANKDIGSFRNVTLTGELDAATGDFSGDVDVDGTLEADAITLNGTALGSLYSPIAGSSSIVTVGTIGTGTWQGTAVASAYLDADTAHLSTTQTFSGAKTFSAAAQFSNTVTVGENGTGYDVQLFGDTAGSSVLWDQSADDLILTNAGLAVGSDATGDLYYRNSSGYLARLGVGSDGQVLTSTGTLPNWEAAAGGGHTIQEEGSSLTQRTNLNFVGAGVTATDDSGNNATKVTVTPTGASLPVTRSDGSTSDPIALTSAALGESLVSDTSPQLGGNLDVNGQSIVSDGSNENIPITPHGTGSVVVSKIDVAAGEIDGTAIGANSASTGVFTSLSVSDGNITNVGDIAVDTISGDADSNTTIGFPGSDVLTLSTAGSERMRIDSSGNVGIGTATPQSGLHVYDGDAGTISPASYGDVAVFEAGDSNGISLFTPDANQANIVFGSDSSDSYAWIWGKYNGGSPQVGIAEANVGIGMTPGNTFDVLSTAGNQFSSMIKNSNSTNPQGLYILHSAATESGTTYPFIQCNNSSESKFIVYTNGNVQSRTNSYAGISDLKIKQDITDARSYWDDFKSVRFRKFRFKKDVELDADAGYMFGVVSQELEPIFPGLVYETPDKEHQDVPVYEQVVKLDENGNAEVDSDGNNILVDKLDDDGNKIAKVDEDGNAITEDKIVDLGTTTKGVKYSILSQIGLKVVQELQTRLEAAEAKIAALEAA